MAKCNQLTSLPLKG